MHRLERRGRVSHGFPDVFLNMVHEGLEEDAVLGVSAAGNVQDHPEERGTGLVALIRVALGEDGQERM